MKLLETRIAILAIVALALSAAPMNLAAGRAQSAESAIHAVLDEQVAAWNRGDVEGFMAGYWRSEKLTFVSSSGVTRGWQGVLERYHRSYPDKKAMGTLTFSNLEITVLSPDAATVLGHWQLERDAGRPEGYFTLILRKLPEGWRIIQDHTSVLAAPK